MGNMKKIYLIILLAAAGVAFATAPIQAYYPYVLENVEGSASNLINNAYAYAPATVYHDGRYHQFYCSTGGLTDMYYQYAHYSGNSRNRFQDSWDHIRYRTSKNGSVWSAPSIAITQAPNSMDVEHCACDPAIVYSDDDKYWYLFYQGGTDNYGGTIYVARSKNIQGPYEKYYGKKGHDKWDRMASKPTPILRKKSRVPHPADSSYFYNIGQISVVKYDGKFHFWFNEMNGDSVEVINGNKVGYTHRYHVAVNKVTDLQDVNMDSLSQSSVQVDIVEHDSNNGLDPSDNTRWHFSDFGEVRMNVRTGGQRFEMWVPNKYLQLNTYIRKYYSSDGIHWTLDRNYKEGPYNYIHNVGVSGDGNGYVYNDKYMLSFGGPENSLYYTFSDMKRHGHVHYDSLLKNDVVDVQNGIWTMWQKLNKMDWWSTSISYTEENQFGVGEDTAKNLTYIVGDFDGDGVDELGAVDTITSLWYLRSSTSGHGRSPLWGKKYFYLPGNDYKIVHGDYDGDGITDFGAVFFGTYLDGVYGLWKVYSSRTGGLGVPNVPAYWKWYGLTSSHVLLNGDYDGDGMVDLVAFLPSTRTWYMISTQDGMDMNFQKIMKTTNASATSLFGYSENVNIKGNVVPVVGDFDGDHITDMAFVDVNKNEWYIRSSQTGNPMKIIYSVQGNPYNKLSCWPLYMMRDVNSEGVPSNKKNVPSDMAKYKFLPGDYDGDGITDFLIVNPSNGVGKLLLSRVRKSNAIGSRKGWLNSVRTESFPEARELASKEFLVGDFDGNGYSDVCIVDKNTGKYYIKFYYGEYASSRKTPDQKYTRYVKLPTSLSLAKIQSDEDFEPSEPKAVPTMPQPNFNVNVQEGKLIVTNASAGQKVSLFNLLGKEINQKVSNGQDVSFAAPAKGMYIVRVGKKQRMVSIK